ncbi:MAG: hypothetical protein ACLFSQ_11860 [Candidatus Zixiibacteriota bacterium]
MPKSKEPISENFQNILNDNKSGSVRLAKDFLELIVIENHKSSDIDEMADILIERFPEMAVLQNIARRLKEVNRNKVLKANKLLKTLDNSDKQIAKNAQKYLPKNGKVMTISQSHTIYAILELAAKEKNFQTVYLSFGYPQKDGLDQAEKLLKLGHKVVIFPDLAYGRFVSVANIIIVGADQSCDELFVNRNGTMALALMARYFDIPFYVAASKMKQIESCNLALEEQEKSVDGILQVEPVFEIIQNEFVTKYIGED